jgi:uracil-DNA glycosylase
MSSGHSERAVRDHAATASMLGMDAVLTTKPRTKRTPSAQPQALAPKTDPAKGRSQRMAALRAVYEREAPHQHFNTTFTNIVWGDGSVDAQLMFVGEAPGRDEDLQGVPFVGRAGQLLDKMIVAMGLERSAVYIANVLKTRPPNNATPTTEEARLCAPYLYEQISIIAPKVIVTLGLPATHLLLETTEAMGSIRGQWASFRDPFTGSDIPVMPTYHPAFLLRSYTPENRKKVWSDLQMAMTKIAC